METTQAHVLVQRATDNICRNTQEIWYDQQFHEWLDCHTWSLDERNLFSIPQWLSLINITQNRPKVKLDYYFQDCSSLLHTLDTVNSYFTNLHTQDGDSFSQIFVDLESLDDKLTMVRLQRNDQNDETLAWTQYPAGYPQFAAFISHDEDSSTTIYRRFQKLSARNLLYLESELAELEADQDRLDRESRIHPDLQFALSSWKYLNNLADGLIPNPSTTADQDAGNSDTVSIQIEDHTKSVRAAASQRLKLAFKIRDVLKSYQEALKLESDILALSKPDQRPLEGTRRIFMQEYGPQSMITGAIETHLDEKNEGDLCVLAAPIQQDRLTSFLTSLFKARTKTGLPDIGSRRRVSIVVSILSAGLAITYFLGAILLFYWVDDPNKILGMLCALIVSFAASVAIFTHAQRHEVITATAGYATILIVILSANLRSELLANISISNNNHSQETSSPPTTTRNFSTPTSTTVPSAALTLVRDPPAPSKIVLGIGLGLGLPVIFAIFAICIFFLLRGRKKKKGWMAARG